jgi:Rieske Fe-S protein
MSGDATMPTTASVSRRAVIAGTVAVVAGGVAGFAVARNSPAARQRRGTTAANAYGPATGAGGRRLAALGQIPTGGGLILSSPPVVLTRGADGTVHAFSAICTHQGCTVDRVRNGTISCPCHGSTFNADTGAVTGGPAPKPLPAVPVTVHDGSVYTT